MLEKTLEKHQEYIKNETLALELIKKSNISEPYDMNGLEVELMIEKVGE